MILTVCGIYEIKRHLFNFAHIHDKNYVASYIVVFIVIYNLTWMLYIQNV